MYHIHGKIDRRFCGKWEINSGDRSVRRFPDKNGGFRFGNSTARPAGAGAWACSPVWDRLCGNYGEKSRSEMVKFFRLEAVAPAAAGCGERGAEAPGVSGFSCFFPDTDSAVCINTGLPFCIESTAFSKYARYPPLETFDFPRFFHGFFQVFFRILQKSIHFCRTGCAAFLPLRYHKYPGFSTSEIRFRNHKIFFRNVCFFV